MLTKIIKYFLVFMAVATQARCQFTYTKNFFGSGTPVGRYVGNSGLKYVNLNDMTLWNQPTIPKGSAWTSVGINAVLTTDYLPEGLVNKYNSTQTAVDTIFRTPGKDSIQFKIQGRYHAIKDSSGGAAITPAALSKGDDTNVTLTLTGTPSTALLQATTITAGWTGTLADARIASSTNWNTAYTNRIATLTTTGTSGAATFAGNTLNIPVYQAAGTYVASVSGTASRISSTGGTTPVIDIDAAYVGQTSITTLGTIATGAWNGTAIGEIYGGTNQATYTTGDILYASASNTLSKLAASTNGFVLTLAAGIPSWAAPATSGTVTSVGFTGGLISVANPTTTPAFTVAGTSGGIPYFASVSTWASSGALTASALVLGGGAGSSPTSLALGTANQILGMNSGATAHEYKTLAVGTTGTDFAIAHAANSVTFNLPDASASARGAITTGTQTIGGTKTATSQFINQRNSLAATTGAGLTNYNATAATGGAPVQVSPRFAAIGAAWTGAASQLVDFGFYSVPVNGTTPVTGYLQFDYAVNSGAKSNIGRFTSIGTFQPVHLGGISTAPTIAAGTGAGTSPTVSVSNATDISMLVNVTTGTLPVAAGTVVTITFNVPYATAPNWSLSPGNAATALLTGVTMTYITTTTTTAVMTAGATALVAATNYIWSLILVQ